MKRGATFLLRYLYGLGCAAYLFTFGILSASRRQMIRDIADRFGYPQKRVPALVPTMTLAELPGGDPLIQVLEPLQADGNVSILELVVIAKLVRSLSPTSVFEIGTFDGRTTLNLAANSPPGAKIYTLDLPQEGLDSIRLSLTRGDHVYTVDKGVARGSRFVGTECGGKIVQLFGDSATFDFSPFYNWVDFVFIDGAHSRHYVLNDTNVALRLLRGGKGLILWHDYAVWDEVTEELNRMISSEKLRGLRHIEHTSLVCLMAR